IAEIIAENEDLSTLETALAATPFGTTLNSPGTYTFFAPTNEAFDALPAGMLDMWLANEGIISQVLRYHTLGFSVTTASFSNGLTLNTLSGETVTFTVNAQGVFVNDALITVANLQASNGMVHIINAVLIPNVPEPVLPTIADIVIESSVHQRLETLLTQAGLLTALNGSGTFTLFAPLDEAFEALAPGVYDLLLSDIPTLTNLLNHHVAGQEYMSTDLFDGQTIMTLNNDEITVTIDGSIYVNGARIVVSDIEASNGIVHVLDAVMDAPEPPVVDPNVCFANSVILFDQKKQNDGSTITESHSDALNALGMPEDLNDESVTENVTFVSLGFGGEIILSFEGAINNGEGDDVMVYEATPNTPARNCTRWPEKVDVFASQDNCNWIYLGRGCQDASFDLGPLSWAQYIRIRDVSNPSGGLFANLVSDGYDLDGVACMNGFVENPEPDVFEFGYATEVTDFNQGPMKNGNPVAPARSDENNALGLPQNTNAINFVSLGFGGNITLKFDYVVFDQEGADLQIVETSYGNVSCTQYPERANVEGSLNGVDWTDLNVSACQDVMVDINLIGALQYIRVTDRSNASQFSGSADGYDLDGVVVLNACDAGSDVSAKVYDNNETPDETALTTVYPNPFKASINVEISTEENDNSALIEMSNALGQKVKSERVNVAQSSRIIHQLSTEKLEKGIYFVSISMNSGRQVFRVVKN
ncbi:MAG: fasciclin domain-containing protein, partial [Bacteroidetes bacterium]|nr:fasciclin domain-containing protein [Bacteroidota bacterium]